MAIRFKLDLSGIREIETGDPLKALIAEKAHTIASRAATMSDGGEFKVEETTGRYLAFANVHPEDDKAIRATLEDNVILKSMGGA